MSLMLRFTLVALLLLAVQVHCAWGQLTLRSFEAAESDLSAQKYGRQDADGKQCALIRVQLPVEGCVFEGDIVGDEDFKVNEYWLYVRANTKKINIRCPGIEASMIVWQERLGPTGVKAGKTYMMWLDGYKSAAATVKKKEKPSTSTKSAGQLYDEAQAAFREKNYAAAVSLLREAAEKGHAKSQSRLGLCYLKGYGLDIDYEKAFKWFTKAADQGDRGGQVNLGSCYYKGNGVTVDYSKAVYWFKKSAEQEQPLAQMLLGECYYRGNGVDKDYAEAYKYFRLSADQGYPAAQYRVGCCFRTGHGVAQDYKEAVKWYRLSAEQGFPLSMYDLGMSYEKGFGVTKDMSEAIKWYRKAANEGYGLAENRLEKLAESGQQSEEAASICQ